MNSQFGKRAQSGKHFVQKEFQSGHSLSITLKNEKLLLYAE